MHRNRLFALAGALIGVIGLFMESLSTDGEAFMSPLHQADRAFPDGIPTIWGGLASWAQIIVAVLIVVVVVISLRPVIARAPDRNSSIVVTLVGVTLLAYAVVKFIDTGDRADRLAAAFGQAFEAGAIPAAVEVTPGVGFVVPIVGTVLVTFGGAMGLIGKGNE